MALVGLRLLPHPPEMVPREAWGGGAPQERCKFLSLPPHPLLCPSPFWFQLCLGHARGTGAPREPRAEATRGWGGEGGKQRCVLKSASFWPRLNFQALGLTDRRGKGAPAPRGAQG